MNKNIRYEVLCPNCKKGKVLNTLLTVSSWSDELITVAECNKILCERNLEELTLA